MADMGMATASRASSARVLLRARQGSYRGTAVVPGKDLARVSWISLARISPTIVDFWFPSDLVYL